jgi:hypothetical protein
MRFYTMGPLLDNTSHNVVMFLRSLLFVQHVALWACSFSVRLKLHAGRR